MQKITTPQRALMHRLFFALFALLVAGRYVDEWACIEGEWHFTDRFIEVQFKNDLNSHMHTGSQPYN